MMQQLYWLQEKIFIIKTITNSSKETNVMENLLYIIAVILVIGWLVGFIGYSAGGIIHILLVIAVIAILLNVIRGRRAI